MSVQAAALSCPCGANGFELVHTYRARPDGETVFSFSEGSYRRELHRCEVCGHIVSRHDMGEEGELYAGAYVDSTYGDRMRQTFERIINLPPERSDNAGRVRRVNEFVASRRPGLVTGEHRPTVLDVGSGLCVFLHAMKLTGWDGTALDPDPRAAAHARDVVGVRAVCADFFAAEGLGTFDLVTFNKVLEHVPDPVAMLARARSLVRESGFVYVELPDGEAALEEGPGREEFFIEHYHVFSAASLAILARRAGFTLQALERLREPSTKYTVRAFLTPQ